MKHIVFIVLCLCISQLCYSDGELTKLDTLSKNKTRCLFEISGFASIPNFKNSNYKLGYGWSLSFFSKSLINVSTINGFHFQLGGAISNFQMGKENYDIMLYNPSGYPKKEILSNYLFQFDLRQRFVYDTKNFSPYIELIEGIGYYYSEKDFEPNRSTNSSRYSFGNGNTNNSTFLLKSKSVFNYGIGAGCLVHIDDGSSWAKNMGLYLDFKTTYLASLQEIQVVDFNNLSFDNFTYTPDYLEVIPNQLLIELGIGFWIGPFNSQKYRK